MEPVTIAYIFFGTLWVMGAITYLQIMAIKDIDDLTRPLQSDLVGERGEIDYEKPKEQDNIF